jgi:hypothetical protein
VIDTSGGGDGGGQEAKLSILFPRPQSGTDSRSATFLFAWRPTDATVTCEIIGLRQARDCISPRTYQHLKPGQHTFRLRMTSPSRLEKTYTWTIAASENSSIPIPLLAGGIGGAISVIATVGVLYQRRRFRIRLELRAEEANRTAPATETVGGARRS